jgi:Ca2+-binding EF-hand superfamily protein
MTMWKKLVPTMTAAFLVTTLAANAGEPYFPRKEKSFGTIDANKNGEIDTAEFSPIALRGFTKMDVNGDKTVTSAEIDQRMTEAIARRRDRLLQLMDRNKDGSITEAELDKIVESMFNVADTDHNGGLTLAEMQGFKRGIWRKGMLGQSAN